MLVWIEISTLSIIDFLFETASFWHNMKWTQKAPSKAITDSQVLKMFQQQTYSMHRSNQWS